MCRFSYLPARNAFGLEFVRSQTTMDSRLGEALITEDALYQWLRSTAPLQSTLSPADEFLVNAVYAQSICNLGAGLVEAHPAETAYVLGIHLCVKLGSTASDIDTELLRLTQLIKTPVVAVKTAQRAKEVASSILVSAEPVLPLSSQTVVAAKLNWCLMLRLRSTEKACRRNLRACTTSSNGPRSTTCNCFPCLVQHGSRCKYRRHSGVSMGCC